METKGHSRRDFLKIGGVLLGGAGVAATFRSTSYLTPIPDIENPLEYYPNRDWEKVYRDIYQVDDRFAFLCAPNDTHNCLLMAHVRNGVITRIEPSYRYGKATDLYGNQASHRWEPRVCQKGLALTKRFYGDRRVKGAMVRRGFLEWAREGFPRNERTGKPDPKYFQRGKDEWEQLEWAEAYELVARAQQNIAGTYSGEKGADRLERQEYDPAMIDKVNGAGVRTLKFRGGMPFLGATRMFGFYRYANMMGLLDHHVRKVKAEAAAGATYWDSYTWHTDLPPGHPMVTGQQTVDFDLFSTEKASLITCWGMNWISTKMPDAHWLSEARLKGSKVIVISCDYQSTANKADEVVIIRPGTDAALALGIAHVLIRDELWDKDYVKSFTDLPLLVRMDNLKVLKAADVIPDYTPAELKKTRVMREGEGPDPITSQEHQYISEEMREAWNDCVVWDNQTDDLQPISRDQVGDDFLESGIDPALSGTFTVTTVEGEEIEVRPIFGMVRDYLEEFSPENVSEITWAPAEAVESLARDIAANKGETLLAAGMGPNHFFNADLKDRALFLVASLSANIGNLGGSPGSYAGNYRGAYFNGLPFYIKEDPFEPQLDPDGEVKQRSLMRGESAHFYNYGDRPLRVGGRLFMGDTHIPAPTKAMWFGNSNSLLGNSKWSYDVMHNTLPKIECIVVNEWWWTWSCEYADVVFGVDSWAEFKHPDMAGSVTNPFVSLFPRTPLPRIFDTRPDIETLAGVAEKHAELTGDERFRDYWHFVHEGRVDRYLQRIADHSTSLRGYDMLELEEKAKEGEPTLLMTRTYPKVIGWEQTHESKPWYTKSGRCEFYRDEDEFIDYGENLPVYREPVDGTHLTPNIIIGRPHPALRPSSPSDYGISEEDLSTESRQVRNVIVPWSQARDSQHPLHSDGYRFVFHTPKFRHGAHSTPVDIDTIAVLFGPFTDRYRRDRRMPWVGESYVDMNPEDARALGIEDGDYIWIDADPSDRPYRGWKEDDPDYKVARLLARARYYPATPRGVTRMWHNMYQASHGTVEAHESREDGLAKNPRTGYQAMFRYGGHQATTRAWLRPTLLTDTMVRKETFGQEIGQGFEADTYCANGAPKESIVRIEKAEAGGMGGEGLWWAAAMGIRPTYENETFQRYLQGGFVAFKGDHVTFSNRR